MSVRREPLPQQEPDASVEVQPQTDTVVTSAEPQVAATEATEGDLRENGNHPENLVPGPLDIIYLFMWHAQ
jgi:hypothetical protein